MKKDAPIFFYVAGIAYIYTIINQTNKMKTLVKNQNEFDLTIHSLERIKERFYNLSLDTIQDAFNRSKMLNTKNSLKYGKTYERRVYGKAINEPDQKILVNPYYDITFVVNTAMNTIITVYSFSKGNE